MPCPFKYLSPFLDYQSTKSVGCTFVTLLFGVLFDWRTVAVLLFTCIAAVFVARHYNVSFLCSNACVISPQAKKDTLNKESESVTHK